MADPEPQPMAAPAPDADADADAAPNYAALEAHVEQVKQDMYEQARWVEGTCFKPLSQMKEILDTLNMLSTRMDNLEAYLGLQDSAQPIVLNNELSEHIYHLQGGPSWRSMTNRMEAEEDVPTAGAVADSVNAEASKLAEHVEEDQHVVGADAEDVERSAAKPDHAMVDTPMAVLNEECTPIANAEQVEAAVPDATGTKLVENPQLVAKVALPTGQGCLAHWPTNTRCPCDATRLSGKG